jgi:phosphoribosylformylglycinamidine cyclo-ligase
MAETGGIAEAEMLKTFNCGIGMILSVSADRADELVKVLEDEGESVARLGTVTKGAGMRYEGKLL